MDNIKLWQTALAKIEPTLSRPNFLTWFQGTGISDIEGGTAVVFVPNAFAREWLQNKYHKAILHALREVNMEIKDISYIIGKVETSTVTDGNKEAQKRRSKAPSLARIYAEESSMKELTVNPATNLNPRYSLDSFIVGSFNELAHAAALSVVDSPGTSYNPLFLYGGVGLGKTHLMQAIGNEALKQRPQLRVRYTTAERYMGEVVSALKHQEMGSLKDKYRAFDLLIVDDVQFMARTEKMQEEFFHIFNSLYEKNKQIVISSDRPPQAMATLEARLRSRFEGGMIADVGLPDYETRLLIITAKASTKNINIPKNVLEYIATNIKTNIRELEGALNRVVITAKLSNAPIDLDTAKKAVLSHIAAPKKFLSPKKIIKAVADFYEIPEADLVHRSRKKEVVKPRQIAMYIMREELKSSYPSIGEKFGGRDHTTAIHSCEKITNDLKINPDLEEEIQAIKDKVYMG